MQSRRKEAATTTTSKPRISKSDLDALVEEATIDAYDESEQVSGIFTMLDDNLEVPFKTKVFGVEVTVERVDLDRREQIIAVCVRGRERQTIPILDLPLPTPPPEGSEWIDAMTSMPTRSVCIGCSAMKARAAACAATIRFGSTSSASMLRETSIARTTR